VLGAIKKKNARISKKTQSNLDGEIFFEVLRRRRSKRNFVPTAGVALSPWGGLLAVDLERGLGALDVRDLSTGAIALDTWGRSDDVRAMRVRSRS
jgi:hypothetical protein